MADLRRDQASVVAFMFQTLPIADSVDTLDFSLSGSFQGRFHAAYAHLSEHDNATVVFTIPTYTTHVLVGLTRRNERDVARILANVEDHERETKTSVKIGEVVILPSNAGSGAPFAVIALRTVSSVDLRALPDKATIGDREIDFALAVPLTKSEWEHRSKHGHDSLMDLFRAEKKELFFF